MISPKLSRKGSSPNNLPCQVDSASCAVLHLLMNIMDFYPESRAVAKIPLDNLFAVADHKHKLTDAAWAIPPIIRSKAVELPTFTMGLGAIGCELPEPGTFPAAKITAFTETFAPTFPVTIYMLLTLSFLHHNLKALPRAAFHLNPTPHQ